MLVMLALGPGAAAAQEADQARSGSEGSVPPIFRERAIEIDPSREYSGELVSMSLRDADLVEVLRSFAQLGDFNLLIQPGVKGTVTVELKEVPWDQAMSTILKINGLGMEIEQGTMWVAPIAELERLVTEPPLPSLAEAGKLRVEGELEYVDARQVVRILTASGADILSPVGRAWATRGSNELGVEDHRLTLRKVARVVARLDVPQSRFLDAGELSERFHELWRADDEP